MVRRRHGEKYVEVDITSRYESLGRKHMVGDFRFVCDGKVLKLGENELSNDGKNHHGFIFRTETIHFLRRTRIRTRYQFCCYWKVPLIVSRGETYNFSKNQINEYLFSNLPNENHGRLACSLLLLFHPGFTMYLKMLFGHLKNLFCRNHGPQERSACSKL